MGGEARAVTKCLLYFRFWNYFWRRCLFKDIEYGVSSCSSCICTFRLFFCWKIIANNFLPVDLTCCRCHIGDGWLREKLCSFADSAVCRWIWGRLSNAAAAFKVLSPSEPQQLVPGVIRSVFLGGLEKKLRKGGVGYRKQVFDTFDTEQKWLNECLVFRKEDSIKLDLIHIAKLDSNGTRFFYQKKEFLMPKYVPRSLPGVCKAIMMTTKMKIWDWCDDYLCFGKAGAEFEEGANMPAISSWCPGVLMVDPNIDTSAATIINKLI